MVLEKVKLYLDGTMLRFESDDEDFRTRSVPTGRIEAAFQGAGFTFTDVVQETLVCSVDSFDDVLDAGGAPYGASQEDVAVALNVFLNFKTGGGGTSDNIYTADGTLTAQRTLSYGDNDLLFGDIVGANDQPAMFFDNNNTFGSGNGFYFKVGDFNTAFNAFLTFTHQGPNALFNLTTSDGNLFNINNTGVAITAEDGPNVSNIGALKSGNINISCSEAISLNGGIIKGEIEYINAASFSPDKTDYKIVALQDCTINLPDNPEQGTEYVIYSNGFNVTVNPFGTQDINGAASLSLTGFESTVLDYAIVGVSGRWVADISSTGALVAPTVADEAARDSAYPSPSDGQRVFNSRTQEIETYDSTFGLWLSPTKKVAIRQSALLVDRFVYVNSFFTVSGVSYPALDYPTDGTEDNQTFGVIVEIGASIDVARDFVAVAVGNQHFVDFGEAIAVGEFVSAKIAGVNADQGFAAGNAATAGRAGIAVQNSGATIGKPTKVLVQLNLLAESF